MRRLILPALLALQYAFAQSGPQPPCGTAPVPLWAALGETASVKSWSDSGAGRDWKPPACVGWTDAGFTTLVTTAARFRHTTGADGLLRRIGAISELSGMRYWSTTHQQWQTLIVQAYALDAAQPPRRRRDFTVDELKPGHALPYVQIDNLTGRSVYSLRILESAPDRIVCEVENVSTLRYFLFPVFAPGDIRTVVFLDRESEGVWRYYGIMRIGRNVSRRIAGNDASAVNRAVAFYRHLVGIPTGEEPPTAP